LLKIAKKYHIFNFRFSILLIGSSWFLELLFKGNLRCSNLLWISYQSMLMKIDRSLKTIFHNLEKIQSRVGARDWDDIEIIGKLGEDGLTAVGPGSTFSFFHYVNISAILVALLISPTISYAAAKSAPCIWFMLEFIYHAIECCVTL